MTRAEITLEVFNRGPPLLDEGQLGLVHRTLPLDQALGEALERLKQHLVERAEVVVDESLIQARLARQAAGRDPRISGLDQ